MTFRLTKMLVQILKDYVTPLILILMFVLNSCSHPTNDIRLERIDKTISASPKEAIDKLSNICRDSLSKPDQYYYDLLCIKARDKAYISHQTDTIIIPVIEYYRSKKNKLYPEALYYGGRIYSDLGDYPTALRHFQQALDNLDTLGVNRNLRARVLSQTGRLLNSMRMYTEAVPCLEEALTLIHATQDTFSLAYSHQLLGTVQMHMNYFDAAEINFNEAAKLAIALKKEDRAFMDMYRAAVKYRKGALDSALSLIRNVPLLIDSNSKNTALDYALRIYICNGITDTAYIYAKELAFGSDNTNRKNGLRALLSSPLRDRVPSDSLREWTIAYDNAIERHFNHYESDGITLQRKEYNYNMHLRELEKAKKSNVKLKDIIHYIILAGFGSFLVILILAYRNKKLALRLSMAINSIKDIRELNSPTSPMHKSPHKNMHLAVSSDTTTLRQQLLEELVALGNANDKTAQISDKIKSSLAYNSLRNRIDNGKIVHENDILWKELENTVLETSPLFKNRLELLTGSNNSQDLHLALLIKCGIKSKDMQTVYGKEKGTISYYRRKLCRKIFGKEDATKLLDRIITLL